MSESTDTSRHSLKAALAAAALLGRGSDSMIAHISPREAKMLRESGGSGARNPITGLLEFDGGGDNYVGPPQPQYGNGSPSGLPAFNQYSEAFGTGFGSQAAPAPLAATAPTDFAPVSSGATLPSYVSSDQGRATELAAQQSGGAGFDVGAPTIGTFNVNDQQNYGFLFPNGLFAPAFLPTAGETPTSLNADQQSGIYPAALAGETVGDVAGGSPGWTDVNNVLTPTPDALTQAAAQLPNTIRAYADTGPDPWAMLGLLGPAIAAGPVLGGFIGALGAGAIGAGEAGAAAAGAGAAADAGGGIFDLGALLGTSPAATTALATGDVSGLLADAGGVAGAAGAASGAIDLSSLGLDPTTASLLGIGGDVGVPGFTAGGAGLADAGTAAGGLGLAPLSDSSGLFLGATDQTAAALPLTTPTIAAPSDLGAGGAFDALGSAPSSVFDPAAIEAQAGSGTGWLSGVTDPINSFVNNNSGLFKALGLGTSALSLGGDLLKGNKGVTGLTGGSQLNTLAGQLAQPGGVNPTENANLAALEKTAQTVNQGQVGTLTDLQGQAATSGNTLQSYLTTGTLPPAVQASVDQATQAAITSIKAGYAARGIPANSSMEIQDINTAKQNATAQAAQLMQSLSTEGLTEQQLAASIGSQITGANTQGTQLAGQIAQQLIGNGLTGAGISEAIYQTLLQADQNQQTQTGSAIANLARALSGGTTLNLTPK